MSSARAITVAIFAMGGEGGGVLADWLVDLAETNGYIAQTTSVPGVAQRTGATVYYLEFFAEADVPAGARPVLGLSAIPGEVDVVLASELMEAGRAVQRGLVTPERTTLVASTHRVYSMTERTALGDGRVDAAKLEAGAKAASLRYVGGDFGAIADQCGSLIGPVLYGALAGAGVLPFSRAQFEDAIRRGGVGVGASLKAFGAGFDVARGHAAPAQVTAQPVVGPRLGHLARRIASEFPPAAQSTLSHAVVRLADYQDEAYAAEYLDRLAPLKTADATVLDETARHLALWMSYEDAIRVADLKTRRSRFQRVAGEVKLAPSQQLDIHEFMHPRLEEIADTLPAAAGRWLLGSNWARACLAPLTRRGRVVKTSSLRGYLMLYVVASLRPTRRRSLRFQTEQQRMGQWLAAVRELAPSHPALALEVARTQRLVKGYGDTHARGWHNFQRLMAMVPSLRDRPDGGRQLRDLGEAALADDTGQALDSLLASVRIDGMQQGV